MNRFRLPQRSLGALMLAAAVAAALIVWYSAAPRGMAGAVTRGQGMELLDAIARNVHSIYVQRTVRDETLYQGAIKGLLDTAGPACARAVNAQSNDGSRSSRERFEAIVDSLGTRCAPRPSVPELFYGAARGMLDSLGDPYTRFMEPRAYQEFRQDAQGFFFGIGIFIDIKDGHLIVVQPIPGTPAARAGLRAGDRIAKIDDVSTDGMALQEAVVRIRGPKGTSVRLEIQRGSRTLAVQIVRDRIEIVAAEGQESLDASVRAELRQAGIGYVKLVTFNDNSVKAFDRVVADMQRAGARALIFDLRNNGGGLLDVSLEIANRFIPAGRPLVHTVNRNDRRQTERATTRPKISIPVVVLVNEFTASASEIVAGALQDNGVATLLGTKTFGKGVIQSVIDLPLGSGAAITTAKYLTPDGHDIHKKGLTPDMVVGESEESLRQRLKGQSDDEIERRLNQMRAEQLTKAINILKTKIQRSSADRAAA